MIPPEADAASVAAMEDVLAVFRRPPDDARPVACVDEGGKQLAGDARPHLPVRPTSPAEEGGECVRAGVANLFPAFEPPAGWRHVEVTERRTGVGFARSLRRLVDGQHPDAGKVVPVLDNLSARAPAALYRAFDPAEARRLEWHYTPRHGSWLDAAECELSVLARQCPDRRTPGLEALRREVAAWENDRSRAIAGAEWQFTAADARVAQEALPRHPAAMNHQQAAAEGVVAAPPGAATTPSAAAC